MASVPITIIKFNLLDNGQDILAFADLRIDDWIIKDFKVVKTDGQSPHVEPPQTRWQGKRGDMLYKKVVLLPHELRDQVYACILSKYAEEKEKRNNGRSV